MEIRNVPRIYCAREVSSLTGYNIGKTFRTESQLVVSFGAVSAHWTTTPTAYVCGRQIFMVETHSRRRYSN